VAIEVAIVEDDRASRAGLQVLIDGTPGFRCKSAFGSVEGALRADGPSPDVILLDINLPGMPGSEGVAKLREKHPRAAVLMLTVFDEEERIFESICNGASGYLLKKTPPARLLDAICEVNEGGAPMSPEIARKVIELFRRRPFARTQKHGLTDQQVRVLALLAEGHSYQSAAGQLAISINTVRNHVRAIYDALHVHSKSEAVSTALRRGII
jgi:DNA-binding NarL/FixJ family response regulator